MRFFILLLLLPFITLAQDVCRPQDHYEKWISFERKQYEEDSYVLRGINDSAGDYCYAPLVKGRYLFFEYLFVHATAPAFLTQLDKIRVDSQVQSTGIKMLQKDTLFTRTFNNLIARTVAGTKPKDSLDFDDVLNVAVKFFNVNGISKDGGYKVQVCVGFNGLKETMKKRNLLLEAFSFDAVMRRYQMKDDSLSKEFIASAQDMAAVSLGTNRTAQLHRAQGAVYLLMWRSQLLRRTLWEAYETQKTVLPFVIRPAG